MARYLYGKVKVQAIIIDAEDDKEALAILKRPADTEGKILLDNTLTWAEHPGTDITAERDGVLAAFLNLMQNEIPRSSARSIIVPPWRTKENQPKGCICEDWVTKGCKCGALSKD